MPLGCAAAGVQRDPAELEAEQNYLAARRRFSRVPGQPPKTLRVKQARMRHRLALSPRKKTSYSSRVRPFEIGLTNGLADISYTPRLGNFWNSADWVAYGNAWLEGHRQREEAQRKVLPGAA